MAGMLEDSDVVSLMNEILVLSGHTWPSNPTAEQTAARDKAKEYIKKFFGHIKDHAIIKGIATSLDTGDTTLETFGSTGIGDHSGKLEAIQTTTVVINEVDTVVTTKLPVEGAVKLNKAVTAAQTNNGTGHIE